MVRSFAALFLLLAFVLVVTACGSSAGPNPLATFNAIALNGEEAILDARGGGVLTVTDECVLITSAQGRETTVVWTEGRVSYDAVTSVITFVNPYPDSSVVELRDGDRVVFGGYGIPATGPQSRTPDYDYVRPPGESCPAGIWHAQVVQLAPEE